MHIKNIHVKNFRLLQDVQLQLENPTTVIVGRNNSGKTSITELFRRILNDGYPRFCLEDFSLNSHQEFYKVFSAFEADGDKEELESQVPFIEIAVVIDYTADESYGTLNQLIIDLDPDCSEVHLQIHYQLKQGKIISLFEGIRAELDQLTPTTDEGETINESQETDVVDTTVCIEPEAEDAKIDSLTQEESVVFYKLIRQRLHKHYKVTLVSVNPSNPNDTKIIEWAKLRSIIQSGFINAQRGLDDITQTDRNTLGQILESLFNNALSEDADDNEKTIAMSLETTVKELQKSIDSNFTDQLGNLLPSISLFGYPGLRDQEITTETSLDAGRLLKDHTKILYSGVNGINLPESYNGLGARNLIFILLKLLEFFNNFKTAKPVPSLQIIFIEEPEAHLHPQMQTVFIRQLNEIAKRFADDYNNGNEWPVQFIVTSHSSHLANEAPFDSIRYFTTRYAHTEKLTSSTVIKDLRIGLDKLEEEREFLHQYMTLTRCDLLFADKAILIEGTCERLLLPEMISKVDSEETAGAPLGSQFISVVEVGGAYAHIFFELLKFLELPSLIITDLDAVRLQVSTNGKKSYPACLVHEGERTSNACIKKWFDDPEVSPHDLIGKDTQCKIHDKIRLAYQIPEEKDAPCGRTLEDAFILANQKLFEIEGETLESIAESAATQASRFKKSEFALKHALSVKDWEVPRYIKEGLSWLRGIDNNNEDNSSYEPSHNQATNPQGDLTDIDLNELIGLEVLSEQ